MDHYIKITFNLVITSKTYNTIYINVFMLSDIFIKRRSTCQSGYPRKHSGSGKLQRSLCTVSSTHLSKLTP